VNDDEVQNGVSDRDFQWENCQSTGYQGKFPVVGLGYVAEQGAGINNILDVLKQIFNSHCQQKIQ
jgi:hypothetical protein